jgi:hypothetical protein
MAEPPSSSKDLHARKGHSPDDKRKRKAEAHVTHSVASAMAGEVIAAVTGKPSKPKD